MDVSELRLVDPARNRARVYAITECVTLFGELCLRIVWGRLGHRRLRERSETFGDRAALKRRRNELLARRVRHGYLPTGRDVSASADPRRGIGVGNEALAVERAIVEAHGLPLEDAVARELVSRWHASTVAIVGYLKARGGEGLDLVDASTLAAMFVDVCAA